MRIGFDIDGVLADFSRGFMDALIASAGVNRFLPDDDTDAPCWDWDKYRGYTSDERKRAWSNVHQSSDFWMNLPPLENVNTLRMMLRELERKHEVYFLTNRIGQRVKRQTEIWLVEHLKYPLQLDGVYPTVLITEHRTKGDAARTLGLHAYIDDNYDNVHDVALAVPTCRVYLRNRRYNQQGMVVLTDREPNLVTLQPFQPVMKGIRRVDTLGQMFDWEIENEFL